MGSKKIEPSVSGKVSQKSKKAFSKRMLLLSIITVLVVVGASGSSIYFYIQYRNAKSVLGNSTKSTFNESAELIKKVDKLIKLPDGENPTIATVSDVTKLKNQPFFANAKNGDKVLIFTKSKKAILYDPVSNRILESQAVNIGEAPVASESAAPLAVSRLVLLNGTKTPGLATTTERILISASKSLKVVSKGNTRGNYQTSLVVDLTGKNASISAQIARILKAEVGKMPLTEVRPKNADILVILGK